MSSSKGSGPDNHNELSIQETLTPDRIDKLLSVIKDLAELIKNNGMPEIHELNLLLASIGLRAEWAINELRLWAHILFEARQHAYPTSRDLALRALRQRGLPEATAFLALDIACPSPKILNNDNSYILHSEILAESALNDVNIVVDKNCLIFTDLLPGQSVTTTLNITGGPGIIEVGSDLIEVNPDRFGSGQTIVTVMIKGGTKNQILWDYIRLKCENKCYFVPVTAHWQDKIEIESNKRQKQALTLDKDLSHLLKKIIQEARNDIILNIKEGIYEFDEPLVIDKNITFKGRPGGKTIFRSVCNNYFIRTEKGATFNAENISFVQAGSNWADIIIIDNANIILKNCTISGATRNILNDNAGNGIVFLGLSKGLVTGCHITNNQSNGIAVFGYSAPTISENICTKNRASGIAYFEYAMGQCVKNLCHENYYGISITSNSRPSIESNDCRDNDYGIFISGSSGAKASRNTCCHNKRSGIKISEEAAPSLENNILNDNLNCGLIYIDSSSGIAINNEIKNNHEYGIKILLSAKPNLNSNKCVNNKKAGIAYFGRSGGHAIDNICKNNDKYGFYVADEAIPTIESNICMFNKDSGITMLNYSKASALHNLCDGNKIYGIYVADQSSPHLEANQCKNSQYGIYYCDLSAGRALFNVLTFNVFNGIFIGGHAKPDIERNECLDNKDSDIAITSDAKPLVKDNICMANKNDRIYFNNNLSRKKSKRKG